MVSAVDVTAAEGDGDDAGVVTRSALAAAAASPALAPSAHGMPAAKHHTATTPANTALYAAVNVPSSTATPISSDTATTRGIRPRGLSWSAVAPAIAAAPAADVAAPAEPQCTATAATTRTPSKLRATAPTSGTGSRTALIIRLFSPPPASPQGEAKPVNAPRSISSCAVTTADRACTGKGTGW